MQRARVSCKHPRASTGRAGVDEDRKRKRSGPRAENDVSQAPRSGVRLALGVELRSPREAQIVAHACRLRQRRIRIQALKTAIDFNVHAVLIGALPDICCGMFFFAPSCPAAETTTHRNLARNVVGLTF